MDQDIDSRLREGMDKLGTGFPATESGVEISILKKLFTEEEAEIYLACTEKLEPVAVIAGRLNREPGQLAPLLRRMSDKGLLFSAPSDPTHFAAAPWLPGICEFNSLSRDKKLALLFMKYFNSGAKSKGNFLRIVPVNQEIPVTRPVAPYDSAKEIIKSHDRILVAPCACVKLAESLGAKTDQPVEICLLFGFLADFYADKKLGRWVTQEEALKILQQCEEAGLVHEPSDTTPVEMICNCGKFCGNLTALRMESRPAETCNSNYFAQVDGSFCIGCEACVPRCYMTAITVNQNGAAEINRDRCIGCGLCVSVCPVQALSLQLKTEGVRHTSPENNPLLRTGREFAKDLG